GIKSELYETFPVAIIEKIEIIKGPGSVLYGSNAFSAVINVVTQDAESNGFWLGALGVEAGAYGTSGGVTVKSGNFRLAAAGRYLKKSEWTPDYEMMDATGQNVLRNPITIQNKGPGAYLEMSYKNLRFMS